MSPWETLGIDPTSDPRAIRSAYVRRLKAIDVDADPAAFIALREALDAAQTHSARVSAQPDPEHEHAPAAAEIAASRSAASSISIRDEGDEACEALARMLFDAQPGTRASPEEGTEMRSLWKRIMADPRSEELAHLERLEQWLSRLIASTVPYSDYLVIPAVRKFGWDARADDVHFTGAPLFLAQRAGPLKFASIVSRPDHPLNPAWRELMSPADPDGRYRRGAVSSVVIDKLVSAVLHEQPELYTWFDPQRLKMWNIRPAVYFQDRLDAQIISRPASTFSKIYNYFLLVWVCLIAGSFLVALIMSAVGG